MSKLPLKGSDVFSLVNFVQITPECDYIYKNYIIVERDNCLLGKFNFFRFITILYYLNDVEEGGETAFLIADNTTTTPDVSLY